MSRRRQTDNRNRTRTRNRRKTKTKTKRDFTIHVSQHEKDLIESLRTIEDLEDFNAHHFGNEFVDAKYVIMVKILFIIIKTYLQIVNFVRILNFIRSI